MMPSLLPAVKSLLYIALQYASYAPAMLFNLVLLGVTGGILWLCLPRPPLVARSKVATLAVAGLMGTLYMGVLSLLLAMIGVFSGVAFYALWMAGLVAAGCWGLRSGVAGQALHEWRQALPVPRWFWFVLAVWLVLYARPFEMVIGGRDPGVYINVAAQIAERGAIAVNDPFFASLAPALQRQFVWCTANCRPPVVMSRFPGYFWIGGPNGALGSDPGLVLPQFLPFYPALMAPGYAVAGYNGALTVLPFGALILALIAGQLAQLLFGETFGSDGDRSWPAALPVLFILLAPAVFWFGRMANADLYLGLFLIAAAYFWVQAEREREGAPSGVAAPAHTWLWLLAMASFGAALFTKIDSWLALPGAVLALLLYNPSRLAASRWVRRGAWAGIAAIYLAMANWLIYPYILSTLRGEGIWIREFGHYGLLFAGAIILIVTVAGLLRPLLAPTGTSYLSMRVRPLGARQAAAIPGLLVAAPILGGIAIPRLHMRTEAFGTLLAYWPLPLLVLSLAGFLVLITSRQRWASMPLLFALACNFVYNGRFFAGQDLPWDLRRMVSIVFPVFGLLAGGGAAAAVQWLRRTGWGSARQRAWLLSGGLVLLFVPLAIKDVPILFHDEFWQAREQMAYFRGMFPSNAVVLSSGTEAANYFGPGLASNGRREVLEYFTSDEVPAFDPKSIDVVAEKARAEGRPFFYITQDDNPPPTDYWQFADYWRGTWVVRKMSGAGLPELLRPAVSQIYYRVYQSLGPVADGKRPDPRAAVYEAESLLSLTGHIVADASAENGWARSASAGSISSDPQGVLTFGPYAVLPAGSYTARFRMRRSGANGEAPDEVSVMGRTASAKPGEVTILASRQVTESMPTYAFVDVPFSLDEPLTLEYTVRYGGAGQTWIDRVEVVNVDVKR